MRDTTTTTVVVFAPAAATAVVPLLALCGRRVFERGCGADVSAGWRRLGRGADKARDHDDHDHDDPAPAASFERGGRDAAPGDEFAVAEAERQGEGQAGEKPVSRKSIQARAAGEQDRLGVRFCYWIKGNY